MGYGIDIGASAVRVVSVRRTLKGWVIDGAARKRLARTTAPDEAKLAAGRALKEALGSPVHGPGVVGLSGRDVNLRVMQQPNTAKANFRQMMFYELEQARGTEGDLYADYCLLREPDAYFPQYLAMVGMGKRAYVDERIGLATSLGVDVRDAAPNTFALFTAYRQAYGAEGGTVLLLDIGAETMEFVLVRGGRMIFARNISTGSRAFDTALAGQLSLTPEEAEAAKIESGSLAAPGERPGDLEEEMRPALRSAAGQLSGILQSTIGYARQQLNDKELAVDKMYVSGGGARLKGLVGYLQSACKMPVEPLDVFKNVSCPALSGVEDFAQLPTDLACPLGLAMMSEASGAETSLSILPPALKRRREFLRRHLYLAAGSAALVLMLVTLTVVAAIGTSREQAALDEFNRRTKSISDRIAKMNTIEADQRAATAKVEMLVTRARTGRGLLDLVARLRKTLPEGIILRDIRFVDLAGRPRDAVPRRRCLFHHPTAGLVAGEVLREDLEQRTITLRSEEKFALGELVGYTEWDAPSLGIAMEGEIDENLPGGASHGLTLMKEQLNDASRNVTADIEGPEHSREKPGWRTFTVVVRFE